MLAHVCHPRQIKTCRLLRGCIHHPQLPQMRCDSKRFEYLNLTESLSVSSFLHFQSFFSSSNSKQSLIFKLCTGNLLGKTLASHYDGSGYGLFHFEWDLFLFNHINYSLLRCNYTMSILVCPSPPRHGLFTFEHDNYVSDTVIELSREAILLPLLWLYCPATLHRLGVTARWGPSLILWCTASTSCWYKRLYQREQSLN